jgi:hypothetical protein
LSICHDGSVEAIEDIVEDWISNAIKDFLLCAVHVEDVIIHERNVLRFCVFYYELRLFVDAVQTRGIAFDLFCVEGSKSAKNFNVSFSFHTKYYGKVITPQKTEFHSSFFSLMLSKFQKLKSMFGFHHFNFREYLN